MSRRIVSRASDANADEARNLCSLAKKMDITPRIHINTHTHTCIEWSVRRPDLSTNSPGCSTETSQTRTTRKRKAKKSFKRSFPDVVGLVASISYPARLRAATMPSAPASPILRNPSGNRVHRADFNRHDSAPSLRTTPIQLLPRHHVASPLPRQISNSYLFDAHSSSASSPSIAPNSSSGFQQHQHQHQNQHSSSAHYQHHQQHQQHHQHHLDHSHGNDTITTNNNSNNNSSTNNNNHLHRIAPLHLYQSQPSQNLQQQPSSTYQPHTTAGNDIPPAPYTFPPSATLLSSLHSNSTTADPSPTGSSYLNYNPYSNGSAYNAPSAYLPQGQTQGQTQAQAQNSPYVTPSGSRQTSYTGLKASPGPGAGGGTGGSKSDYVAAYGLSVANAVAGNLRGGDAGEPCFS